MRNTFIPDAMTYAIFEYEGAYSVEVEGALYNHRDVAEVKHHTGAEIWTIKVELYGRIATVGGLDTVDKELSAIVKGEAE